MAPLVPLWSLLLNYLTPRFIQQLRMKRVIGDRPLRIRFWSPRWFADSSPHSLTSAKAAAVFTCSSLFSALICWAQRWRSFCRGSTSFRNVSYWYSIWHSHPFWNSTWATVFRACRYTLYFFQLLRCRFRVLFNICNLSEQYFLYASKSNGMHFAFIWRFRVPHGIFPRRPWWIIGAPWSRWCLSSRSLGFVWAMGLLGNLRVVRRVSGRRLQCR